MILIYSILLYSCIDRELKQKLEQEKENLKLTSEEVDAANKESLNILEGIENDEYKGEEAVKDTARVINLISKKRVNIMSYFIQDEYNSYAKEAENKFKLMYGKNAKFVDVNNINIITKTLNELLLKKDLVS